MHWRGTPSILNVQPLAASWRPPALLFLSSAEAHRVGGRTFPAPPAAASPVPTPLLRLRQGLLLPVQAGYTPVGAWRSPTPPVPRLPQGLLLPLQAGCPPPHAPCHRRPPTPLPALPQGLRPPLQAGCTPLDPRPLTPLPVPRLLQVLLLPLQADGPPPHAPCHRRPPLPLPALPQSLLLSLQAGRPPPLPRPSCGAGGQASGRHRCSSCDQAFGQRCLLLLHQRGHQAKGQGKRELSLPLLPGGTSRTARGTCLAPKQGLDSPAMGRESCGPMQVLGW